MCLMSNIVYAQSNYFYITADLETNEITIDSDHGIKTEFDVGEMVRKADDQYIFTFSYSPEADFDDFKLKIILPEETIISEKNDVLLLSRPAQISTDGRRIFIEWNKQLKTSEEITIFAEYEAKGSSSIDSSILFGFLILVLIAFVVGYKIRKFKKDKFVEKAVSQDEKTILNILKKEDEIMQEDLREKTGWSKTKISKVLRRLEAKELIQKKPYRKTNKLKIKQ